MKIRTIKSSEYPLRYVAWDNPKCLVLSMKETRLNPKVGFDVAVFSHEMVGFKGLKDGIYGDISYSPKGEWFVRVIATRPNKFRKQWSKNKGFKKFKVAKEFLLSSVKEAYEFVKIKKVYRP